MNKSAKNTTTEYLRWHKIKSMLELIMENNLVIGHKLFEDIKRIDENGGEYWLARELQEVLQYAEWRNFCRAIDQAKISCKISQHKVADHFIDTTKTILMPVGKPKKDSSIGNVDVNNSDKTKPKEIKDYILSRYACYLIVMNGDPRKEVIANGQTYFAVKTRQQEYQEIYQNLSEDERRIFLRGDIKQKNNLLAEAAKRAGINEPIDHAIFNDFGYMGLYGGLKARDIAKRKKLGEKDNILDHMGSAEMGANIFRITQTEELLNRNQVDNKDDANQTHYHVGKTVRKTMKELGNTVPENLPTPEKSTKEIEKDLIKKIKGR